MPVTSRLRVCSTAVVEPEQAGLDVVALPVRQRLPVGDGLRGDDRVHLGGTQPRPHAGAHDELLTRVIEHREVHAVVHVPQLVDIAEHHTALHPPDVLRVDGRQLRSAHREPGETAEASEGIHVGNANPGPHPAREPCGCATARGGSQRARLSTIVMRGPRRW